jgi:hypothetical protein
MPKRVIDFDAMWGSDKLASCADWAQAEYAWLYGLADASGCFEMTNLRVIWGRVAAVRGNFTIERLEQVFAEFQDKGLLFVWAHEGKRYAHWTGSDAPGRLPPPSWRMRLEKFAPPVPKLLLAEYMGRFARGRAALAGAGFRGESAPGAGMREGDLKFEISDLKRARGTDCGDGQFGFPGAADGNHNPAVNDRDEGVRAGNRRESGAGNDAGEIRLKCGVEEDQAQDWGLNLNLDLKRNGKRELERCDGGGQIENLRGESQSESHGKNEIKSAPIDNSQFSSNAYSNASATATSTANSLTGLKANSDAQSDAESNGRVRSELNANTRTNSSTNPSRNANFKLDSGGDSRFHERGHEVRSAAAYPMSAKEIALERELRVGEGPVCGPVRIRPEVLERIRLREEKWARARAGTRAP